MDFIPVLIVVGVVGFLVWKNKDKLADKFKKPEAKPDAPVFAPVIEAVKPVAETPAPVAEAPPPTPAPQTGHDNWLTRANKPSPEVAAYMDSRYANYLANKPADWFAQFPTVFPGSLLLGEIKASGFTQAVVNVGPDPIEFSIAVPENYSGSVYFDLTPHPNDPNGDAYCQFTLKDWGGNVVADVQGRLDQLKLSLSGVGGHGHVKVNRGTYLAKVKASKVCKTLFSVSEA